MRHRKSGRKFGRTSSHRKAMMMNLCNALIEHEVIKTTLAKAKELRGFVEPMVTVAKADSLSGRRLMFSRLRSRDSVIKLFSDLGPRFNTRPGGYVRVLKCGFRQGDNAPMAIVEFVDRDDASEKKKAEPKKAAAKKDESKATKTEAKPKSTKAKKDTADAKATEKKPAAKKTAPKTESKNKAEK